ncbi:TetR/AcrR family transcriptional regulator [Bradyrhizobium sp. LHD-71]|uniref:TetR/AcrR family transcriptional regulator n=1 Tax=Bradyrhizobium sp. LHD-71 TaxID=3072141 RepID=UPI00280F0939|nr:TetR/AcrR family transcriptional regulator [Bradyrhizobium sp. LHD-71]MDQ8726233.1 TetR/AcrR family transcriptional regulator [Bradyrhizobium sp. LHD-71]
MNISVSDEQPWVMSQLEERFLAKPPEGRREQTKARNRAAILAAAKAVFAEKGYEAATVRDIIRSTDLASGTFYNYFNSKEEIAAAIATDAAMRLRPILQEQREKYRDLESYLDGIMNAYFRFLIDEYAFKGTGRRRFMRPPTTQVATPAQRAVFEEIQLAVTQKLGAELASDADVEYITASVTGIARNVGLQMLYRKPQDPDHAARFAVGLILRGLAGLVARHPGSNASSRQDDDS